MNLERKEFLLICDATTRLIIQPGPVKDQIYNSIRLGMTEESLDEKWNLNRSNLYKKLDAASESEFLQLWNDVQNFWERHHAKDNV